MFEFDFDDLAGGGGSDAEEPNAGGGGGGAGEPNAGSVGGDAEEAKAEAAEEVYAVGSWAYTGRRGLTIYKVRKTGTGHLLFEGPDASGDSLSGVLQREGPQLLAELVSESGKVAGSIRLTPLEGEYALVSNFRTAGKTQWGTDIKANRYYPAQAPAQKDAGMPTWVGDAFTIHPGFIRTGGDIYCEMTTVAQAKVRCDKYTDCKGFSFKGEPDTDAVVKVYYKDKWDLVRGAEGWTSYRFEAAMMKLSDLPGAGVDEEVLAELAKSWFSKVYVFKSPLASFPEWKKQLKVHQIVLLSGPDGTNIQLEYFVGGVHFQRKPYPWVHRGGAELVDEVTPSLPEGGFTGKDIAKVVRKWLQIGRDPSNEVPASKDCIIFAMELVNTVGAMTSHLLAHFQSTLGMQHDGWD